MTAELLRAVYWFNPLIWVLCQRLRVESEYACDDAVLAQGITGPEYAAQLLDIVCLLQVSDRPWSSAMGMASPSTIERRFAAMLNPRVNRRSVSRFAMMVIAVAGLGVTLPLAALSTSARVQAQTHESIISIPNSASPRGQSSQLQVPSVQQHSSEQSKPRVIVAAMVPQPSQPQVATPAAPAARQQQAQFKGEKISLDVNSMRLGDFLKLIGTTSGLNVITDPDVKDSEPLTFHLANAPWDQVLDGVLNAMRLTSQLDGNVLRIRQAPTSGQGLITMDFEIYRNGLLLGAPRITTVVAHAATVEQGKVKAENGAVVDGALKITATPSRTGDNKIEIQLEIFVDKSGTRDVLVVSNGETGSISWRSSSSEPLEARITASEKK